MYGRLQKPSQRIIILQPQPDRPAYAAAVEKKLRDADEARTRQAAHSSAEGETCPSCSDAMASRSDAAVAGRRKTATPDGITQFANTTHDDIHSPDVQARLRDLIRTAREHDHLTWDDINDALPAGFVTPDLMDALITRLRAMEIKIIDEAEVDGVAARHTAARERIAAERDAASAKLDVFDDPVRMYLRQMGQVPLLTREQEIQISKRIEKADLSLRQCLHTIGFIGQAYLQFAEALCNGVERFDRLVSDRKADEREMPTFKNSSRCSTRPGKRMKSPPRLFEALWATAGPRKRAACQEEFDATCASFFRLCEKFYFKSKITEDFVTLLQQRLTDLDEPGAQRSKNIRAASCQGGCTCL
jgi:RNA polymerase primary sigma factor